MRQGHVSLLHRNTLRLGLFGANCVSGRTYARLPERWDASWDNTSDWRSWQMQSASNA